MLSDDSKAYLHVSAFSGLWNVPYITGAYLIHGSLMEELRDIYSAENVEPDMAFCGGLRKRVCVVSFYVYISAGQSSAFVKDSLEKGNDLFFR